MSSKFTNFVLNTWINHERYRGFAKVSAILLNGLLCIIKLFLCVLIMLFVAPYLGAQVLRNRENLNCIGKIAYVFLAAISIVLDLPFLCLLLVFAVVAWRTLTTWTLHGIIASVLCGLVAYGLLRLVCILVGIVFCKSKTTRERIYGAAHGKGEDA